MNYVGPWLSLAEFVLSGYVNHTAISMIVHSSTKATVGVLNKLANLDYQFFRA
ncbi:hypothetical protein ACUM6W_04430 [Acinetobacter tandoii]|uniref:hypothetical protein n=1 Tax=Acinetobacter tandoii TaxID=202954 RepID=UPI0040460228